VIGLFVDWIYPGGVGASLEVVGDQTFVVMSGRDEAKVVLVNNDEPVAVF
jgi:hypothetical protein